MLLLWQSAATATIHVTTNGAGDGSGWGAAATSLENALAIVSDGEAVWVAEGTYTNASTYDVATNNVTIYGGFTNGMATLGERDWDAYPTRLDGEGTRRVMTVAGSGVTLDGLVFTNGWAQSGDPHGGGIYKSSSSALTINNCSFLENRMYLSANARFGGGGYFKGGTVTLSNCTFRSDVSSASSSWYHRGLGFYAEDASVTVIDCTFTGLKYYTSAYYSWGVGFHVHGGSVNVMNTTFSDCWPQRGSWGAGGSGVASLSDLATGTFTNCTFINNAIGSAWQDDASAGIFSEAAGAGGASIHVYGCTFTNLRARTGAAIALEAGSATVEHSTFIDCDTTLYDGGAFYLKAGTLEILNCTITGCDAVGEGGVVYNEGGTLTISNSILWANTAATFGDDIVNAAGGAGSVNYCLLSGDETDTAIIYDLPDALAVSNVFSQDPLFASDADVHLRSPSGRWNGGWDVSDTHPHSPGIDAGAPAAAYGNEVAPHGLRRNLGRYGNTAEASKSPGNAPIVENRSVTTNGNIATMRGELVTAETIADVRVYYTTNATPTNAHAYVSITPPQQTGTVFSVQVTGLDYSTTYYYRCYATNGYGESWASAISNFTTGAEPPGGGTNVIHVDTNAVSGGGTGDNWFNAFTSFKDACAAITASKTQMWIAAGTFIDPSEAIISGSVHVYGGFTNGMTMLSERDPDANPVYLDGNDLHRVLKVTAGPTLLDGVIITNGYGPNQADSGGGIHKDGAFQLTLANCRIVENLPFQANTRYGGGAYFKSGTVVISNCFFANPFIHAGDIRYRRGYGFYAENADVTVIDSVFSNNIDTTVGYYNWGGAIHVSGGSLSVTDTDFLDNKVTQCNFNNGGGGAVYIQNNAEAGFTNCLFSGNEVQAGSNRENPGGAIGIYNTGSATVRVDHCTFLDNIGTFGGAIYLRDGNLEVEHCTMAGNYARTAGSKNGQGGAIYVETGEVSVRNSILWTNTADLRAADIANIAGSSVDIDYCILSGDPGGSTVVHDGMGTVAASRISTNDPLFASSSDVHLQSPTGRWDPGIQGFVTTDTVYSPAIDAGDTNDATGSEVAPHGSLVNLGRYGGTAEASKTSANAPTVENRSYTTNVNVAVMRGELVDVATVARIRCYYGTGATPTNTDSYVEVYPPQSTGTVFTATVKGLGYNTTYYYRFYATNAYGEDWANAVSNFTTGSQPDGGGTDIIHVKPGAPGDGSGKNWFDACENIAAGMQQVNAGTNEMWVVIGTDSGTVTINIGTNVDIYGGFTGTETQRTDRTANRSIVDGNYPIDVRRAFSITDGTVLLDGFVISNCYLPNGSDRGLGLYGSGYESLTLQNCTFVDNDLRVTGQEGGGAYLLGGTAVISNCLFHDNTQYGWYNDGALRAVNVTLTVIDSVFSNNTYSGSLYYTKGGAMAVGGGTLDMRGCTFVDNAVPKGHKGLTAGTSGGGAIHLIDQVVATISNSVFLNNDCEANASFRAGGGAIEVDESGTTATVVNCTIAYSDAYDGGALLALAGGDIVLKNSILWTNTAVGDGDQMYIDGAGSTVTSRYTCITDTNATHIHTASGGSAAWGDGIIIDDPLFASATDLHLQSRNGRWDPLTSTFVEDAQSSPCIDAGNPLDSVGDETEPNGGTINMGAYGGTVYASRSPDPGGTLLFIR